MGNRVLVLAVFASSWGWAHEPSVRKAFYPQVESPTPLELVEPGESLEFFFTFANGAAYGIKRVTFEFQPGAGIELVGPKRAVVQSVAGSGGQARVRLKVRLKSASGTLVVKYTATYAEGGGGAGGESTLSIGGQTTLTGGAIDETKARAEVYRRSAAVWRRCFDQARRADPPLIAGEHLDVRLRVDDSGAITEAATVDDDRPDLTACVLGAAKAAVLSRRDKPLDVELRLGLVPSGDVLLVKQLEPH